MWSKFLGQPRKTMNAMYNRVWRRVHGSPRFGRTDLTDLKVRMSLHVPSLDCYMRRARLKYLLRIVPAKLPALLALL